jgi:hypothetical protein
VTKDGAETAATQFYSLYTANNATAAWGMLIASAKRQVSEQVWTKVHQGCSITGAGTARSIKSVVVFGSAAIVTEEFAGSLSSLGEASDVFSYANGRWTYSPQDMSIYLHGSVSADIVAAKSAGYCGGTKISPL